MSAAATIPYQLRPLKAIERNLFINILKLLDRSNIIDISNYRYIGFGAPFLDDFKIFHLELGITRMDCVEYNTFAYSRQKFNRPYSFIKLFNTAATDYITSTNFKQDRNQIIWWDFAYPGETRQQLLDTELTCKKLGKFDIIKLTFNSSAKSFAGSNKIGNDGNEKKILNLLKEDSTYQKYLPETTTTIEIVNDFSSVLRAMAIRAIKRGLGTAGTELDFHHISSFKYKDGQEMTTITGIICTKNEFLEITNKSGLNSWQFAQTDLPETEFIKPITINVPAMTLKERLEIDKKLSKEASKVADSLKFYYGENEDDHSELIKGYCLYYKYLPYYTRVTY